MSDQVFDVAIIGSGPGGYRAAVLAALRGLKAAIIERATWGGTCLNRGCVPKKAWYQSARLIAGKHQLAERGLRGDLVPDLAQAWRDQRRIVETVRASYIDYLERLGVRAYSGSARLCAPGEIEIDGCERLRAANVVVATGSVPVIPPAIPLHPGRVLTTDELFDHPPPRGKRIAVVGSGVIGTEMAFILVMLGLEVVWLTHAEALSRTRYSAPALTALRTALRDHGIAARTGNRPIGSVVESDGVLLSLRGGGEEKVDWVLVAAGRSPCTSGIALDAAGVACDEEGYIRVDDYQRTSVDGVYAIGDCTNRSMTSNHALAEASVAIANIVAPGSARRGAAPIPQVVYSALELARVGLSEDEAEAAGREVATGFAALETSPAALALGDRRGFARLVADAESGEFLGAEAVGIYAGEWIHLMSAYAGKPDALAQLAALRYNHPSLAEEILNATETLAARWGLGGRVFGYPRE
ncbi:MAG: NAD(P)/FAD-dependent oxidoreductase [Betaproteobacteria bacterium]|jgi:dihydrolipoamide dehydrogenase|nr:NAD(P)/FAD-dependent oxidoreductase [Betaproteobacteria bacterium]